MTELLSDPKINEQNYVLLSFLSPERIRSSEYNQLYEKIQNEPDLKKKINLYEDLLKLKTNLRGVKIRGTYNTYEEAVEYTKSLRDLDPSFDIYIGTVGDWLPFDDSNKTEDQNYANEELNKIMHEYNNQQKLAKTEFEKQKKEKMKVKV